MTATPDPGAGNSRFAQVPNLGFPTSSERAQPNLEELVENVRRAVPIPSSISRLEANLATGIVDLTWQSRHFVVKPTLEVFELKGKTLFITGVSMLIQTVLTRQESVGKIVKAVNSALERVEDLLRTRRPEAALSLLSQAKSTVARHAGVRNGSSCDYNGRGSKSLANHG